MKKILFTIFLSAVALTALAADEFVNFAAGDWQLNANGSVTIYVSDKDERGVMRAAKDLVNDLKAVTGALAYWWTIPRMQLSSLVLQARWMP